MKLNHILIIISLIFNVIAFILFLNVSSALKRTVTAIEIYRQEELELINTIQEAVISTQLLLIKNNQ